MRLIRLLLVIMWLAFNVWLWIAMLRWTEPSR